MNKILKKVIVVALCLAALVVAGYYSITDTIISKDESRVHVANFIPKMAYKNPDEAPAPIYEDREEFTDWRDPAYWVVWNATKTGEIISVQEWRPNATDPSHGEWKKPKYLRREDGKSRFLVPKGSKEWNEIYLEFAKLKTAYAETSKFSPFGRKVPIYPSHLSDHAWNEISYLQSWQPPR